MDANALWYASVKYVSDDKTEYVPITDISEIGPGQTRTPFNPKSLTDFERGKIYYIKPKTGSKDGRVHPYNGFIGRLAESKEDMKKGRNRTAWPPTTHKVRILSEPESSCNEQSSSRNRENILMKSRQQNKSVLVHKRTAQTKKLEELAAMNFFDLENNHPSSDNEHNSSGFLSASTLNVSSASTFNTTSNATTGSTSTSSPTSSRGSLLASDETNNRLIARIKFLEEQLEKEKKEKLNTEQICSYIDKKLESFESKLQETVGIVDEKLFFCRTGQ